jgi:hypothetical protein
MAHYCKVIITHNVAVISATHLEIHDHVRFCVIVPGVGRIGVVSAQGALADAKAFGLEVVMYRALKSVIPTADGPAEDKQFRDTLLELAVDPPDSLVGSASFLYIIISSPLLIVVSPMGSC